MGGSIKGRGVLLLLVACIWGSTFAVMKDLLSHIPFLNFLALRFFLAGIFLSLLTWRSRQRMTLEQLPGSLFMGFLLFGGYVTQVWGLMYTTASQAGFITGLSVVMVPFMAMALGQERPRRQMYIGVGAAFLGLYLLTFTGKLQLGVGEMLVFLCAIFFALYIVYVSRFAAYTPSLPFVALQLFLVAFLMAGLAVFLSPVPPWNVEQISPPQWWAIVYMGILATALAYLWEHWAQKVVSATFAAIALATEPVFATMFAFLYLGEVLPLQSYLGGGFIFLGMILAGQEEERQSPAVNCSFEVDDFG